MRRPCQGFTLLELMIVMVVIGVLLGMVSFATGPNPVRQAREEAQMIASLVQQLRERAVLDGGEYGLRLSDGGYRAMRLATSGWEPLSRLYPWPADIRPQLEQDGHRVSLDADAGPAHLLMLSSDETSNFTLTLGSGNRTLLSLSSDGLGEVSIDG